MPRFSRYRVREYDDAYSAFQASASVHMFGEQQPERSVIHRPGWSAEDLDRDLSEAFSIVREQLNHLDAFGAESLAGPLLKTTSDVHLVAQEALARSRKLEVALDLIDSLNREIEQLGAGTRAYETQVDNLQRAISRAHQKTRHLANRVDEFLRDEYRRGRVTRTLADRVRRAIADLLPEA